METPRSRSLALALGLSLLLHVAGWLILSRLSPPAAPPPPREAQTVEIELQAPAPASPVVAAGAQRLAAPSRGSAASPSMRPTASSAPRARPPAPATPRPVVAVAPPARAGAHLPTAAASPPGSAPDSDGFPVAAEGLAADAPRALQLQAPLRDLGSVSPGEKVGSGGVTTLGEEVAEAPAIREKRAQQAIDGWVEDDAAAERVESGLVDSYFADIGKSIEGAFTDGEKHAKSSHGKGSLAAMNFLSGYSQSAQRYAATGNPNAPSGSLQDMQQRYGMLPASPGPNPAQGELSSRGPSPAGMATLMSFADGTGGGLVAVVELRQTSAGRVVELSLKHGSGDEKFDKWVLAEVPEGLAKADPPPKEGAGIHEKGLHTLWAFEGRISYMRKMSDANLKDDWFYAPLGTVLGAMGGHFDIGSSDVEYFDPRHPHFVVNAKLLRVY